MEIEGGVLPDIIKQINSEGIEKFQKQHHYLTNRFSMSPSQSQKYELVLCQTIIVIIDKHIQVQNYRMVNITFQLLFKLQYLENNNLNSLAIGFQLLQGSANSVSFYSSDLQLINVWKYYLKERINYFGFHEFFKPIQRLGKGNSAAVFQVQRIVDAKRYAVKAFSKTSYSTNNGKQSIVNEINIMRKLSHQNLIKIEGVYESKNSLYVVIELLKGGGLFTRIKQNKKFTEEEIRQFMMGLLHGLEYLHRHRIMHRDLKPQNIMLRYKDSLEPVIIDYGLATFIDIEKYLFFRCGTPGYVAPEILNLQQNKHIEPECDVFSAGVIFHILLTGKPLFQGTQYEEVYTKNKKMNIDFNDIFYEEFDPLSMDLLKKMLEKNPKDRIKACQALKHQYCIGKQAMINQDLMLKSKNTRESGGSNTSTNYGDQ